MGLKGLIKDYRRTLAILFAILGASFVVGDFAVKIITQYFVHASLFNIILTLFSFAVMVMVCYYLLSGNIHSTYSAYRGMAMFIFLMTVRDLETVIINSVNLLTLDIIPILVLSSMIGAVVVGALAYIKVHKYLYSYRPNVTYKSLFWLTFAFTVIVLIQSLSFSVLIMILNGRFDFALFNYASLGDAFLSLSVMFTVTRLNPRLN